MSFEEFDWKKMVNEGTFLCSWQVHWKASSVCSEKQEKTSESQCYHPPFDTCCFYKWKRWRSRTDYRGNRRVKWRAVRIRLNLNAVSVFLLVFVKTVIIPLSKSFLLSCFSNTDQVLIQFTLLQVLLPLFINSDVLFTKVKEMWGQFPGEGGLNFLQQRLLISAKSWGLTYY